MVNIFDRPAENPVEIPLIMQDGTPEGNIIGALRVIPGPTGGWAFMAGVHDPDGPILAQIAEAASEGTIGFMLVTLTEDEPAPDQ